MKRNIIINGALGLLLAGSMASCASDYLDTEPLSNVTDAQVGATTENLAKAINGMGFFLNMYQVDQSTGGVYQGGYPCGSCGEGYFMSYFGDCYSSDTYQNHFAIFQSGQVVRMELVANNNWYSNSKAWGFYYTLIRQANAVLDKIDDAEETIAGQRNQIKAEALAFRAHAYTRLLQLFAPRWSDSNNGERKCIVLRLQQGTDDLPLVTMNQVLDQIYTDCKDAAALFQAEDTYKERPDWSAPTYEVACGVLARAALLKEDWATAEQYAAEDKARKDEVDTRNAADQIIYQSEKTLNEMGDKVTEAEKAPVKEAIEKLKTAQKGTDLAAIKAATEEVQKAFYAVSEKLYKNAAPQGEPNANPNASQAGPQAGGNDDGVVDADYEEVKDN